CSTSPSYGRRLESPSTSPHYSDGGAVHCARLVRYEEQDDVGDGIRLDPELGVRSGHVGTIPWRIDDPRQNRIDRDVVARKLRGKAFGESFDAGFRGQRSEEHTSELQSRSDLVCRLLLE